MITFTVDYNTAELIDSKMYSIYCIVRGIDDNGTFDTIGEKIIIDPPVYIENFDAITKEQVDLIVKSRSQYQDLERRLGESITSKSTVVVKEFPWNVPPPPPPPPPPPNPVPDYVTPLQIRMAINMMGLREQVEYYVSTLSQSEKDAWEYATVVERTNPVLVNGAAALGKTTEDLDNLFILAASLV
jgi:hypothetical protein